MSNYKKISPRSLLIKSVENYLCIYFESKGFVPNKFAKNNLNSELNSRMPIGILKKDLSDGIALVEVVFYAGSEPKFFVDIAKSPKHGIVLPHGQNLEVKDIHTSALPERYRLSSSSIYQQPFTFSLFSKKNQGEADNVAKKAIKLSDEIIEWFDTEKKGPHLFKLESLVGNKIVPVGS